MGFIGRLQIYAFIVGQPVFAAMNQAFGNLAYTRLAVR